MIHSPKVLAWVEVEKWLKAEAKNYDLKGLPTGLDGVAREVRYLLGDLAGKAGRKAVEAHMGGGDE